VSAPISGSITRRAFDEEQVLLNRETPRAALLQSPLVPIESKFSLVGNAVVARDLFRYTAAAGLGPPVRVYVSQRHGEQTRIDLDHAAAFFSQFPETPLHATGGVDVPL
jgi:hypothetical protein